MTDKQLLEQALEALQEVYWSSRSAKHDEAITAIQARLEQPEQEPVAIVSGYYGGQCVIQPVNPARIFNSGTAFYTTPPAAPVQDPVAWIERWHGSGPDRGWSVWEAGLTHGNRVAHIGESEFAERLTRLIVEKHNAAITSPQPAPAQEPVAWQVNGSMVVREDWIERLQWPFDYVALGRAIPDSWVPVLYTTPPAAQRQFVGLSDEDYPEVRKDEPVILAAFKAGANWAEAKLKEKNT